MNEAKNSQKGQEREMAFDGFLIAEQMVTGKEFHLVVTKGLTAADGALPRIVGARFDSRYERIILEFDRPVPDAIWFQDVSQRPEVVPEPDVVIDTEPIFRWPWQKGGGIRE